MVEQVVGLEFVVAGDRAAIAAIGRMDKAQTSLSATAKSLESVFKRGLATDEQVIRAYIDLQKAGLEYSSVLKGLDQNAKMLGDTNQEYFNSLLGIDNASKSAKDSAAALSAALAEQERNAELAQKSFLEVSRSFGEAVVAANTYEMANKSAADSAEVFAVELQKSEQFMRDQARAFGETVREANTYAVSNKSAAASAEVFSRELRKQEAQASQTARAHQEQMRSLQQVNLANKSAADSAEVFARAMQLEEAERIKLETVYNRTAAAARVYERAVENLNRAEQLGVITAEQKRVELERLNVSYSQVGRSTAHANTFINQFGDGVRVAGIKTNRFGLYAQQVGYQVGDFFVQIQSGTNAFVAFGQQATQLAGLLPGVAGAIVGIGISITTAFLSAWSRAKQATEEATESVSNLSDAISSLNTIQRAAAQDFDVNLTKAFEDSASAVGRLLQRLKEAEFAAAMEPVKNVIDDITVGIDQVDIALDTIVGFQRLINEGQTLSIVQQGLLDDAKAIVQENISLAIAYDDVRASIDAIGKSDSTKQLILNFAEALKQAETLGGPVAQSLVESLISAAKEAGLLEEVLSMADDAVDDTSESTKKLKTNLRGAVNEAIKLRDVLQQVESTRLERSDRITILRAQIAAAQRGVSPEAAAAQAETAITLGRAGATPDVIAPMAEEAGRQAQLEETLRKQLSDLLSPDKGGGGAGGDTFLSMFPELQRAYEQAQKDAQAYNEEVQILDSALKAGKISQQEYNSYLSQAQEVYGQASTAALQYENALLQMANTTSQAMSDAMMSIVDGTKSAKDAFSDMARIIIKKAYEMAVINPILNAIFGGVSGFSPLPSFFANGAAIQGGNVVPFANGGVVGGPATFPMSGGRTGLMGEAGPEAIIPLKRGKDGKLGVQATGGGVVINQSFNISANGDESVKRIVQQQIPNIAQATKAAVVDAKRRGGSYGRAFA